MGNPLKLVLTPDQAQGALGSAESWSAWLKRAGGRPSLVQFDPRDDSWSVVLLGADEPVHDILLVMLTADVPYSACWLAVDAPTAIHAVADYTRGGQVDPFNRSDVDAIADFMRDHYLREFLSLMWVTADQVPQPQTGHLAKAPDARIATMSGVAFQPADLFDKHGFHDGDLLVEQVEVLRAEGCRIGSVELLCAVVAARVLPLLDPSPRLVRVGTSHNPVRALVAGDQDIDDGSHAGRAAATDTWPRTVQVGTDEILRIGRSVAEPLTARCRALESSLGAPLIW
jgi:hypothetical protein